MKIAIDILRHKVETTLQKKFTKEESERIAEYLIWAEMAGVKTQGIIKMTGKEPLQNITPQHEMRVERDTKLSQLINAGAHPAPLVSQVATDAVIAKAKEHGFGIVGVHNTFSSNGSQAFYVERIAKEDLIGIMMSRSPASTAPFDSIDPLFGTNPIGFAFPTNEEPVVFDMATSAMTFYGLILAKARGESIPEHMAIDSEGKPTTDPGAAMDGALLPFDRSYKGSGIGMVVEVMAGPLVKAAYGQLEGEWGTLFIAIDPNLLVDTAEFKTNCSDLVRKMRQARTKSGSRMRLPGDRTHMAYQEALSTGMVEVEDVILKQLGYV
ncbi:MAG TPA: Ldh family oxidoreductase [Patescibacteria group bacterium]